MKKIIFVCLTAIGLGASAYDGTDVKGKWQHVMQEKDTKVTLGLDIGEVITVFNKTCEAAGQTVNVVVQVATKVTDGIFEIQGQASQSTKAGDFECAINVVPEVLKFQVDQDHLSLTSQGNTTTVYDRVK
ncbi:MAG: hypothetical protein A4S09_05285 [Proteobacteria bacterium SG_bin7]|nr:MAG: hypothetical protein A4S09_05285 [Proteobacteria bacterium SG_bin7]